MNKLKRNMELTRQFYPRIFKGGGIKKKKGKAHSPERRERQKPSRKKN